jgi:hypothetical protein
VTISEQALAIKAALDTWATAEHGQCVIACNVYGMWEMASNQSQGPRAILCYFGETPRGDFPTAAILGRVDRHWQLAVTRPQGPAYQRGAQLTDTLGNNRPFYDLVDEARDIIRTMLLDPNYTERPIDYRGTKSMQMVNGQVLDGYIIEFSIGTQLQMVSASPSSFVPV